MQRNAAETVEPGNHRGSGVHGRSGAESCILGQLQSDAGLLMWLTPRLDSRHCCENRQMMDICDRQTSLLLFVHLLGLREPAELPAGATYGLALTGWCCLRAASNGDSYSDTYYAVEKL